MSKILLVYIISFSTGGGMTTLYFPMPDMKTCIESVKSARVEVPKGGDAESTVTVFCSSGKVL